ncbi:hypothetical protein KP004_00665 [Geomonas oryzisoli]|uniref:Restriction endonuclease n=1 Tax=Geomonas oryzisoli TaxID=2847992 RepID=A0ABX8J9I1_9BACT|nr:hypothetical protein [Geomonas oryzisoli]QWV93736.1 hypothetical protein KP004_00665 [Geomonas oryzisoli]
MGEAKRRGTFEERKAAAIARNKMKLVEMIGGRDERLNALLKGAINLFLAHLTKEEWNKRRNEIVESLKQFPAEKGLEKAKPIRVKKDEIGWYLFLCEQTVEDPLCVESSQQQRILPFFAGIGERSAYAKRVKGFGRKIKEVLTKYKTEPDGAIFEILVALSYASKGWDVEFIEEAPPSKTPDIVVRKDGKELFVECKRLDRRTAYAERERNEALRIWDAAVPVLVKNQQWIWLKTTFHVNISTVESGFLADILKTNLPIKNEERIIHDSSIATIHARIIDKHAVNLHLDKYMVKEPSPMLNNLLGGDWAPENSEVSVVYYAKRGEMKGCEASILSTYVEEIAWASGMTRKFDAEESIEKKARDITKLLSEAVKQVPNDKPSVIHVAAETLEGRDVELRRTQKVMSKIQKFVTDKPVLGVRFHRFQSNSRTNMLYEFDETIERFEINGNMLRDIPMQVVVPESTPMVNGSHWEIYD